MSPAAIVPLLLLPPLLGALFLLLVGRPRSERWIGRLGAGSVGLSFVLSLLAVIGLAGRPAEARTVLVHLWDWVRLPGGVVGAGLRLDPLSAVMILVITGVGFLIHVYSIGYMAGDRSFRRFFGLLNFFVFSMLLLVLADNALMMFVGWEGVGLASWALIGFWYETEDNCRAGRKAFLVNRIGDAALLSGLFLLLPRIVPTPGESLFTWESLAHSARELLETGAPGRGTVHLAAALILLGAAGKSAQFPLHVWLPDAMAGPTPVSALIHAATMVTAGVYLLARTHGVFAAAPGVAWAMAWLGVLTALFAAAVALAQTDVKRILAWSTVSQLGLMVMGVGGGAPMAAMFHLVTHAFFKAALFLGAGSVILALHHEQDVRRMGGLRHLLPRTWIVMLVAGLAASGIPPLSGFFSKDALLAGVWEGGPRALPVGLLGFIVSFLTAAYMGRLLALVFAGPPHRPAAGHAPVESPAVMIVPMQLLAFLAVVGGLLNLPFVPRSAGGHRFDAWLTPLFAGPGATPGHDGPAGHAAGAVSSAGAHAGGGAEIPIMLASIAVALAGFGWAWRRYGGATPAGAGAARPGLAPATPLAAAAFDQFGVEALLRRAVLVPLRFASELLAAIDRRVLDGSLDFLARLTVVGSWLSGRFDALVIDGLGVGGVSGAFQAGGRGVRALQTGRLQNYLAYGLLGLFLIVLFRLL